MKPYILTATAKQFWFVDTTPEMVCIEDIAWALAKQCRFTGHSRFFYSVAQHSFMASLIVPERFALEALLHDASEAYMGDMNAPLKSIIPEFKAIEERVERVIAQKFGTSFPMSPTVKQADLRMLATEQRDLMMPDSEPWACLQGIAPLPQQIVPFSEEYAREAFMGRFIHLIRQQEKAA